ncbi:MAG: tetratricopeptide repeat protein [Gammaproteobacteria bacterium]|nr:tetratricopeptide repeat protein [Gammaproteobacteria bacterium]
MQKHISDLCKPALAIIVGAMLLAGPSFAADDDDDKPQATMTERVYKRLLQAQELLGESNYADSLSKLRSIERMDLNEYERALVLQTIGFVYAQQGQYPEAIRNFEACLALNALPSAAQQGMLYSLASLYMSQEMYQKTISTLQRWLANETDPKPDAFIMMASSYASMNDYRSALPWAKRAVDGSAEPKENWHQLLVAIYFELEQYGNAAEVLTRMVGYWPDKLRYWETLFGAYQQKQDDKQALATLNLAYANGLLTEEKKIVNLARMRMFMNLPFYAGDLIEKEIAGGRVERNEKNLGLLLSAWSAAREYDKAIAVIDQLAPLKGDGELYLQQAQLFNEKNNWEGVAQSVQKALDKGGLKSTGKAYLLQGLAFSEQKKFRDAIASFRRAQQFEETRSQATGWIEYVNEQIEIRAS